MITSTVLIVDDEESIRDLVRVQLSHAGRRVLLAAQGKDAVELFRQHRPDVTILDLKMPVMSGVEVLKEIRQIDPRAIVIIFTGCDVSPSVKEVSEARELGVTEFLQKGCSLPAL